MNKLFVGTSGWNYDHWKGIFYPDPLRPAEWLQYYAKHFNSVELNVTFYRLVRKKTFENWYKKIPQEFYFVAKGSRFITHIKRIHAVGKPLDLFLDNVVCLKEKLAAVLWQFPPSFKKNLKRLETFLKLLSRKTKVKQAFEFRNQTWFDDEIYDLLKNYNAGLCVAHSSRYPFVKVATADFLYLRFHGEDLYSSNYSNSELKEWADFAKRFSAAGGSLAGLGQAASGGKKKDIFAFFNNDAYAYAVKNALAFRKLLDVQVSRLL